jgi:hypothetical protein
MGKKVVYIAGPYRSDKGEYFVRQNIRSAEDAALFVWQNGGVALCPHKNTSGLGGAAPDEVWLEGDLELLQRCDAILMIEGWERSGGARKERQMAIDTGMRVFYDMDTLKLFLEAS